MKYRLRFGKAEVIAITGNGAGFWLPLQRLLRHKPRMIGGKATISQRLVPLQSFE